VDTHTLQSGNDAEGCGHSSSEGGGSRSSSMPFCRSSHQPSGAGALPHNQLYLYVLLYFNVMYQI
jgi:hypothetical protein